MSKIIADRMNVDDDELHFRDADAQEKLKNLIVQEPGDAEDKVVSQKETTEQLGQLSEAIGDITEVITPKFDNTTTGISIEFIGYTRLAETGYPVSIPDNNQFNATDYIEISPLTKYKIVASSRWGNSYFAIYDENKQLIYKETETGDEPTVNTFTVTTPLNAKYIIISWLGGLELSKLEVYNLKNKIEEDITDITEVITPKFGNTTTGISIEFIGYTRLAETGYPVPIPDNNQFNATDYIEISPLTKYKIVASSRWGNSYFAIYDENKQLIYKETETGDAPTVNTFTVTTPLNAKYIIISWLGGLEKSILEVYNPPKKWEGLKWVCFGDSLTEKNVRADKSYYDYVAEETGISILNYGKSGTGYFKNDGENQNFLTRIEELQDVDFDIITFFGSFNDLNGGWAGGSTDSTDTTQNNVFGFINATLDRLYEIKPFVKVGIITPTPWSNSHGLEECDQYCDGLIEIAKRRSIPVLDLYRCSNLHPDKENFRVEFYNENGVQDNGTHPNSKGHKRIYPMFREFLKSML